MYMKVALHSNNFIPPLYHKSSSPSLPIHFNMHPFCYYSVCHCNLYNSVFFITSSPEHPSNYLNIIHPEVLQSIGFVPYVYTIITFQCCLITISLIYLLKPTEKDCPSL